MGWIWTEDDAGFQVNATSVVRKLMEADGIVSAEVLAALTGIPAAHLQDRFARRADWTVDELEDLARYFKVRLKVFAYTADTLVRGQGDKCSDCGLVHR